MFIKNTISRAEKIWYFSCYQDLSPAKKESFYVSQRLGNSKEWFQKINKVVVDYFVEPDVVILFLLPQLFRKTGKSKNSQYIWNVEQCLEVFNFWKAPHKKIEGTK